jgi:nicotinamidase-related amidase
MGVEQTGRAGVMNCGAQWTGSSGARRRLESLGSEEADMDTRSGQTGTGAALLVIDLQRGLFRRPTPVHEEDTLLRIISGLVSAARAAGAPVVFVRHSNKMLVAGTESWELHPDVRPRDDDLLLDKTHGDAFQDTELDALLNARSVGTVFVTGLVTEGCVRATCLGGLERGYRVVLVSDAHSSFHRDAARRIRDWNETLAAQLDGVIPASKVDLAAERTS